MPGTDELPARKSVVLVQYAGDMLAARDLAAGANQETYFGHRHILQTLENLATRGWFVTFISCRSGRPYDTLDEDSPVRFVGLDLDPNADARKVVSYVRNLAPTHLILLGPMPAVLLRVGRIGGRLLLMWADSFEAGGYRGLARRLRIRLALSLARPDFIGNHNWPASRSLARVGAGPESVIPWDWPGYRDPRQVATRACPASGTTLELVFVGRLAEIKGVKDCIDAVAVLRSRGLPFCLKLFGSGEMDKYMSYVHHLGLDGSVFFAGQIENSEVWRNMREAFAVVVPSHTGYPEGMPLTLYEALSARTPIIASSHPMFWMVFDDGRTAIRFSAGDTDDLVAACIRLYENPSLYRKLSENSTIAWDRLQGSALWGDVIEHWIDGSAESLDWLKTATLGSRRMFE